MVGALRPGGVLLAESSEAMCFGPADDSTPNARALQMVTTVLTDVLRACARDERNEDNAGDSVLVRQLSGTTE